MYKCSNSCLWCSCWWNLNFSFKSYGKESLYKYYMNVDDGRIMRSWRSCLLYIGLWMHTDYVITTTHILCNIYIVIYNIYHAVTSIKAVACIKRSRFYCPVIENVIWIEPLLKGHLLYQATFYVSHRWPLNTRLTVYILNFFILADIYSYQFYKTVCTKHWLLLKYIHNLYLWVRMVLLEHIIAILFSHHFLLAHIQ